MATQIPQIDGFRHENVESDGVRLHYVVGGTGPAVLLLHGWPQTWYAWRKAMPVLVESGHTVIALDNRGFGDSDRPESGYDSKTMADDVFHLVSSLTLARLTVVGHDWGAAIAYSFAAAHPEMVSALALIEGLPFGPWILEAPSWKTAPVAQKGWFNAFHQIPDLPELLTKGHEREYLTYFYREYSSDPEHIPEADIQEFLRTFSDPRAMRAGFELYRAIPKDISDNSALAQKKLEMPVLALGGELCFAGVIQEAAKQLALHVDGGIVEGANHWIPEEQTDVLLSRLNDVMARAQV